MAEDEGVGTLVVASAGADPQATQVIAQRDASGMPVAFPMDGHARRAVGSADAEAGGDTGVSTCRTNWRRVSGT